MRWLWRREPDGEGARAAKSAAEDQLAAARRQRSQVDDTVRAAGVLARRVDALARDVERAMRLRGSL